MNALPEDGLKQGQDGIERYDYDTHSNNLRHHAAQPKEVVVCLGNEQRDGIGSKQYKQEAEYLIILARARCS